MRVVYVDNVIQKHGFRHDMKCRCGNPYYEIVEQIKPITVFKWFVRCPVCGAETSCYGVKDAAIAAWREMNKEIR